MGENSTEGSSGFYGSDPDGPSGGGSDTTSGDEFFVPDIRYSPEANEPASVLAIIMLMGMGIPLVCLVLLSVRYAMRCYARERREAGHASWMIDYALGPTVANMLPDPGALERAEIEMNEQQERSIQTAIQQLVCFVAEEPHEPCECTLCFESMAVGDTIKVLSCAHKFHQKCIDRWLIHGQKMKPRRCPLCNCNPLGPLETTTAAGSS